MLVESIMTLTGVVIDIANKKAELDRRYFEQFIEPAWEAFEQVHRDYKASFREYIRLVSQKNADVELIIAQIRHDSRQSSDLRSKLRNLVKHIPSAKMKTREKYLLDFIKAIDNYFGTPEEAGTNYYHLLTLLPEFPPNIARWQAINALTNPEAVAEVSQILDDIVGELQRKYDTVADSYYFLRKELLT